MRKKKIIDKPRFIFIVAIAILLTLSLFLVYKAQKLPSQSQITNTTQGGGDPLIWSKLDLSEPNDYFSVDYSFPGPFCHSHFVKEICGDPDCWCMIDIAENNNECFNCVQK